MTPLVTKSKSLLERKQNGHDQKAEIWKKMKRMKKKALDEQRKKTTQAQDKGYRQVRRIIRNN